jgi:hypothetical protein
MNRQCNGDYYEVDGRQWYRCLWDGSVLEVTGAVETCPNCKRKIAAEAHGAVVQKQLLTTQVCLDGRWYVHSVIEHKCEATVP